jgi:GAF domain-containing protein
MARNLNSRAQPIPSQMHLSRSAAADRRASTENGPEADLFDRVLDGAGLHAALQNLNGRTRFRFTGVYRLDPPMMRNVSLFDRENPLLRIGADIPLEATYCSIVLRNGRPLGIADAATDPQLLDHIARETVRAYCAVAIRRADGRCIGTLCHFDLRPRVPPTAEIPLLEYAAGAISSLL